jgi:DNA-binding XRE family transcriptional regulator
LQYILEKKFSKRGIKVLTVHQKRPNIENEKGGITLSDVPIVLKDTLRSLRVKFAYTQEQAAELIGVSVPTLRGWEQDSSNISYQNIKKIEQVYGRSQNYIFFGSEVSFSELVRKKVVS